MTVTSRYPLEDSFASHSRDAQHDHRARTDRCSRPDL
jgi:hypothetical protein